MCRTTVNVTGDLIGASTIDQVIPHTDAVVNSEAEVMPLTEPLK